jgi:putative transposase
VLKRQRRSIHREPGATPQFQLTKNLLALKARFTSDTSWVIVRDMPQSLSKVILHIIFSTKNRGPWLECDVRPRMHAYLATLCRDLGAELVRVWRRRGSRSHCDDAPTNSFSGRVDREIKKASSKWIKALDARYRGFFWQRGYGAFSVSPRQLDAVLQYIEAQQEQHRTRTFQEEYRELLRKHGVEFDERYVWD